jgi:hypothetical protein
MNWAGQDLNLSQENKWSFFLFRGSGCDLADAAVGPESMLHMQSRRREVSIYALWMPIPMDQPVGLRCDSIGLGPSWF